MKYKVEFHLNNMPELDNNFWADFLVNIIKQVEYVGDKNKTSLVENFNFKPISTKTKKSTLNNDHLKISKLIHTAMRACRKMGYTIVPIATQQFSLVLTGGAKPLWTYNFPDPAIKQNGKGPEISPMQAVLIYKKAVPVIIGVNNSFYAHVNTISKYVSKIVDGFWNQSFEEAVDGCFYFKGNENYEQAFLLGQRIKKEIILYDVGLRVKKELINDNQQKF